MHRSPSLKAALFLAVALAGLAGCSSGSKSPTAPTDDLVVTSITPAEGTKLAPGSTVTFTANVSYTLNSATTGSVALVIEDQASNLLNGSGKSANVSGGQGTVTLSDTITVPATGVTQVQVFLPLRPTGATASTVVSVTLYPVGT